jgi:hypothetical protein
MRIGLYLFVFPAVFTFFGMKLLAIHLALGGREIGTQSVSQEIFRQTGGVTIFALTLGILLVIYAQVLIKSGLRNKVLVYVPGIVFFVVLLTYLMQALVLSLMIGSMSTLGLVIVTYRKTQSKQTGTAPGAGDVAQRMQPKRGF